MKPKCIFFDRDGIVNVSPGAGYVERPQDFHVIPEFIDCAKIAQKLGYVLAIATNQRCIARGIVTQHTLDEIHAKLTAALAAEGISLLGIYCCPHERDSCDCRKPKPGLLLQAAADHNLDLAVSWMIGDSETDIEAGRHAGCRTIRICNAATETASDFRAVDMRELAGKIEEVLGS